MNWGKGIVLGLSLFIGFITTLIVILMSNRVDLVSEDYYQREIEYETEMNARQNAVDLGSKVLVSQHDDQVLFQLPEINGVHSYELRLSRPDDQKQDLHFTIKDTRSWLVKRDQLQAGFYDYELAANDGSKSYLISGIYEVK